MLSTPSKVFDWNIVQRKLVHEHKEKFRCARLAKFALKLTVEAMSYTTTQKESGSTFLLSFQFQAFSEPAEGQTIDLLQPNGRTAASHPPSLLHPLLPLQSSVNNVKSSHPGALDCS